MLDNPRHYLREDALQVCACGLMPGHAVHRRLIPDSVMGHALHGDGMTCRHREGSLAFRPPVQGAHIGNNDARFRYSFPDGLDHRDDATLGYAAATTGDASGQHAELLHGFAEDEDHMWPCAELATREDGNVFRLRVCPYGEQ